MKDMHKKRDVMGNKFENMKNATKKLANQSYSILETVADNIKTLLEKLE